MQEIAMDEVSMGGLSNMQYSFQEVPKAGRPSLGMCKHCRNKRFIDPPFGCGWTACMIMTDNKDNYEVEIWAIPEEIRMNCPGFEKKTLFNLFKKYGPRIIYKQCGESECQKDL